mgnify:CR=1 FL=1
MFSQLHADFLIVTDVCVVFQQATVRIIVETLGLSFALPRGIFLALYELIFLSFSLFSSNALLLLTN